MPKRVLLDPARMQVDAALAELGLNGGFMGTLHLEGRRTGRPKGAKSAPLWVRAARWALKNLETPDAVPPSALAGRLLALGREQPDKLVLCLEEMNAHRVNAIQGSRDANRTFEPDVPEDVALESDESEAGESNSEPTSQNLQTPSIQPPAEYCDQAESDADQQPRNMRTLFIPTEGLVKLLMHCRLSLPDDVKLVRITEDRAQDGYLFTLDSEAFEAIPEGEQIPSLGRKFTGFYR